MMFRRRSLGQYGHRSNRIVRLFACGIQECSCSTSSSMEHRPLRSLVPPPSRGNDREERHLLIYCSLGAGAVAVC